MRRKLRAPLALALAVGMVAAVAAVGSVGAGAASVATPVITGLNTPRGITFDSGGNLYVSESGVAGSGSAGLTSSGRVTKYASGSTTPMWTTGFESVFASEDPSQPPDVLGPEGISAFGTSCFLGQGTTPWLAPGSSSICTVRMIMSESHDGIAAQTGGAVSTTQMGHLFALDPASGAPRDLSNVGDQMYQFTGAHKSLFPDDFPDSNPFGVLVTRDSREPCAPSSLTRARTRSRGERERHPPSDRVHPERDDRAVPRLDADLHRARAGRDAVRRDARPACELRDARTFERVPNRPERHVRPAAPYGAPAVGHRAHDRHGVHLRSGGNFWATEMFQPNSAGPPGDVVVIPFQHPSQITHLGGGSLPLPGGIAQGPDGRMYVTINSAGPVPGSGAVVRLG